MVKVGILVGSLRRDSVTKKLAATVADLFPAGYEIEFINIGDLPVYNQDYDDDNNAPDSYVTFRTKMKGVDAVLFVTPEHNRSIPAALKNALDVGSRPYGSSVWDGKPAAIISQSPSTLSGFGANHHLRQPLVFLNMHVLAQPEAYIANSMGLFDEDGTMNNEGTREFLQTVIDAFVELIKKHQ